MLLNKRWLVSTVRSALENSTYTIEGIAPSPFEVKRVLPAPERPWDSNRKFREAFLIASEIYDTMAGLGMAHYNQAMQYLQEVSARFKKGKFEDPVQLADHMELTQNIDTPPPTQLTRPPLQITRHSQENIVESHEDLVADDDTGGDELLTGLTPGYARTDGDESLTGLASTNADTDTVGETSNVPQQSDQSGTDGSQSCTVGAESEPLQTLSTAA
ncbi:unnamed protein product [Phytophthora fragariaefolia]|uniref:Unnamed protein product n=1 Tax=Phytophthora fragariaefolia TaxID=1490495 RepID=A0A9W6XX24_9STRA|nr:unnamed protein product [Phytophthora fragariaefolia]